MPDVSDRQWEEIWTLAPTPTFLAARLELWTPRFGLTITGLKH